MTEVEIYRPGTADVDSWTGVMPDVVKLAEHIAMTEFVPKGLRGKPAAVAAAVLAGREQGIGPMTALTHMHVVEGRPTMSAELKRARVLAAGHEITFDEMSVTRCIIRGRRRGQDSWTTVTWTAEDARRANLQNKDNWRKHPRRMLQARATSELCDLLFPDVVGGLPTTEEARDDGGDYTDATAPAEAEKPKRRTAQRRTTAKAAETAPAKEPEAKASPNPPRTAAPRAEVPPPPLPGEDGYDEPPAPAAPPADEPPAPAPRDEPVTKAQLTKIATTFTAIEWTDRADRLRAASTIVGRPLKTSKDLTKGEASTLIDTLEMVANGPDPAIRLGELLAQVRESEADQDGQDDGGDVVDAEIVAPDEEAAAQAAAEAAQETGQ